MNLSAIVHPRGRLPRNILEPEEDRQHSKLRKMASTSALPKRDIFELGPNRRRSESRQSVDFNRPQSRSSSEKSGLVWPFNKSDTTKKLSLDEQSGSNSSAASKFRVVGRGGSGSKLRQVSVSNPVVVLETDPTSLRPLESGGAFFRPTGRGGLGSLSTNPPTGIKPLKPPTAIMTLLRGRKQSEAQLNEEYLLHKTSPPRRSQSVYYRTQQTQTTITDPDYVDDLSVTYTLEGRSPSIDPDHDKDDSTGNSYEIEEEPRTSTSNEHRERSLNKLTRTLGANPSSMIKDPQVSKSPIFDNFATADIKPITPRAHRRRSKWDSYESDSPSSPITFAPPAPPPKETPPAAQQHPLAVTCSDDDEMESEITIVSREQDEVSAQSHCSSLQESSSSQMPHLHVSTHSTSDSLSSSEIPLDPNGPVAKSDWLVPLNEVVISIRRTAPTKPQSWTGEWNREMKDVIRDLRRL